MPESAPSGGRCARPERPPGNRAPLRFAYLRARSLDEAFELHRRHPGARFVAGGSDVFVKLRAGAPPPPALVSLRAVEELRGIVAGDRIRIGAGVTAGEIAADPALRKLSPALVAAAATLGSVQIRNVATLGGNLANASPCANLAPALLVHEAEAELASPAGRRRIAIGEFFRGPGVSCLEPDELIVAVSFARPRPGLDALFLRACRVEMDLAQAALAATFEAANGRCSSLRLAAASVAPVPLRLLAVERLVEGRALAPALAEQAAELAAAEVRPITDLRASEAHRRRLVATFVRRVLRRMEAR